MCDRIRLEEPSVLIYDNIMLRCILYTFSSNFLGGGGGGSTRLDFVMVINNQNDDGCVPVPKIGTCI